MLIRSTNDEINFQAISDNGILRLTAALLLLWNEIHGHRGLKVLPVFREMLGKETKRTLR